MSMNKSEIKPCPFCGGKAVTSTYYIECESCEVAPIIDWHHMDKFEAIKDWNKRPDTTQQFIQGGAMSEPSIDERS